MTIEMRSVDPFFESVEHFVARTQRCSVGRMQKVIEADRPRSVELSQGRMILLMRRGTETTKRQAILDEWYREQLRTALPPLIAKWERLMGVKVRRVFIQRMKTKWGSCNHRVGSIRLWMSELTRCANQQCLT
jgi:predicted metal-dependent hydrolase